MKKSQQAGFSIIILIAVVAAVIVAGFVAWRIYDANQPARQNSQAQQSANQQTDPNAGYVVIKEWGIRLKPTDGLNGLKAESRTSTLPGADEMMLITDDMSSLNAACSGKADGSRPLGALLRTQTELAQLGNKKFLKEINGYLFYYYAPASSCSPDAANEAIQTANLEKVKASVGSLEAAK